MRQRPLFVAAVVALVLTASCGPRPRDNGGDGGGGDPCGGCPPDQVCVPDLGCRECVPGQVYCGGDDDNTVFECNSDGSGGSFVGECLANQVCFDGECLAGCEAAERTPSNVGCHFWAVDLDNENDTVSDASAQQFAVLAANTNDYEITVRVNDADSALNCTVTNAAVTCSDVASTIDVDPGDEINVEINPNSTPNAANFDWSADVDPPSAVFP